jgi:lysine biosynthesis protein LysW
LKCPECGYDFDKNHDLEDYQMGDIVSCPSCGTELELKCGELQILQIEGEDWGE